MTNYEIFEQASTRLQDQIYTDLLDAGQDPGIAFSKVFESTDFYDLDDYEVDADDRDAGIWDDIEDAAVSL